MKTKIALLSIIVVLAGTLAISQDRSTAIQPARLEVLRNVGLESSKSGLPAALPHEWGKLVSVQRLEGNGYLLFLQNDAGEIYLVRLIQRGDYLYLDSYDQGGVTLVIKRS
jgi:hypothetical protein